MKVSHTRFAKSVFNLREIPKPALPEFAFTGRSNVGKSSLINTLLNRKGFAKTSSTPGRTRSINFLEINSTFFFVDLPGYGYARVPVATRRKWQPLLEGYLKNRESLRLVILLIDVRREPAEEEDAFVAWLKLHNIPVLVVLTKIDKVSKTQRIKSLTLWSEFLNSREKILFFSALTGEGKHQIWQALNRYLSS